MVGCDVHADYFEVGDVPRSRLHDHGRVRSYPWLRLYRNTPYIMQDHPPFSQFI